MAKSVVELSSAVFVVAMLTVVVDAALAVVIAVVEVADVSTAETNVTVEMLISQ